MRVTYNGIFLINTKCVNVKDIVADGNGVFLNIGLPSVTVSVGNDMSFEVVARSKQKLTQPNQFHVRRVYYRHSKKEKFFRRLYDVRDKEGNIVNDIVVVQYVWDGEEGKVKLAPHGNATTTTTPYTATKDSVRKRLQFNLARHNLKEAIDLTNDCPDSSNFTARSPADQVRGVQQANYLARKLRNEAGTSNKHKEELDELYTLMSAAKEDESDFIRCISNHPDPMCILATEYQLEDLDKSCTEELDFRPVTIDPTFKNGRFNVTPVSYRNIMLQSRRTKKCPVFLGPMMIHQRKTFQSYHFLTSQLVGLRPHLRNLKAFGTDGEDALIAACEIALPTAIPLRCFRQNVEAYVHACGLQRFKAEIIGHIFGSEESSGLLDSESGDEFDLRLEQLSTVWASWQGGVKLADYIKGKADMMKKSMISEVRSRAGLGCPPEKFYDNDSESNNERIKQRMEHREPGLCSFVRGMKQIAASQENELVKALYGSSKEYIVRDEFSSFLIQPDDWYNMSEDERRKKVSQFHQKPIGEMYASSTACCTPSLSVAPCIYDEIDRNEGEVGEHPYAISIKADESGLANVLPMQLVQGVWGKAVKLLQKYNSSVCSAPSAIAKVKAFSVLNQSGKDRVPYYVEVHTCLTCNGSSSVPTLYRRK